jgi:restriction system protein
MARKKDSGALGLVFEIAAVLPWWAGTCLAVAIYFLLHRYAVAVVSTAAVPGQVGQLVVGQLTKSLATIGQYLLPLLLLAGAFTSYLGRRKRAALLQDAARGKPGEAIRGMSWREFELLVGEAFRIQGYAVTETGGGGADGGIDLKLKKGSEVFLVQCKQWRAYKVSVNVVRELFGVMAAQGATGGFVVTSGVFTADAVAFASGRNIELIDGNALSAMVASARVEPSFKTSARIDKSLDIASVDEVSGQREPACPRCGKSMVKRIAKQGSNAGGAFWGCIAFPACRGIVSID